MNLQLPPFTFINAPAGSGKTTLSQLLSKQDTSIAVCSFAEPIREALLATFYPEALISEINLKDPKIKNENIPGTSLTHREWMVAYSNFMKNLHNAYIFGDLAKRRVALLEPYYQRFVFDDNRYIQELHAFSMAYGKDACLMIHIQRHGKSWDDEKFDVAGRGDFLHYVGAKHCVITNNGKPEEMLSQLGRLLNDKP